MNFSAKINEYKTEELLKSCPRIALFSAEQLTRIGHGEVRCTVVEIVLLIESHLKEKDSVPLGRVENIDVSTVRSVNLGVTMEKCATK